MAAECAGVRQVIEYDPRVGAWSEKSVPEGEIICYMSDGAVTSGGKLYKRCDEGEWCIESGDIFDGNTLNKGVFEVYIRARVKGYMEVYTVSDGAKYVHKGVNSDGEKIEVFRISVRLKHGNYYRIGIKGSGDVVLYRIERRVYEGGAAR